jgi:putative membrane protein
VRGFWGYFLPLDLTMSSSMLYELIEWLAAEVFGSGLGAAFLGSQGDQWDAQKDMALASLGAFITMTTTAIVNSVYQRDFAAEFVDSLRVRGRQPLGEVELARLRAQKAAQ